MKQYGIRPNTWAEFTQTWEDLEGGGTGFTGTAGYACEWHLDSSTRGTFETILFTDPPSLPSGHKWIFALTDAGVLINLVFPLQQLDFEVPIIIPLWIENAR